jgi:hypothetical protein
MLSSGGSGVPAVGNRDGRYDAAMTDVLLPLTDAEIVELGYFLAWQQ